MSSLDLFKPEAPAIKKWADLEWFKTHRDEMFKKLAAEALHGKGFLPPFENVFSAFELTPLERVKVVILGQDPYHTPGVANGLAFSVSPGIGHPPSLMNIFKELCEDLDLPYPRSGDLTPWARQGVLLLNSILTVYPSQPMSHADWGWDQLTKEVISVIARHKRRVVFILWGKKAYSTVFESTHQNIMVANEHLVIVSSHPSPRSVHFNFFGSKPFSRANKFLRETGQQEINWRIE